MIKGIGTDIIEIDRMRKAVDRYGDRFWKRICTQRERLYCESHSDAIVRLAGRFAAKEAIAKALGTGIGERLSFLDIEICNDTKGQPLVILSKESQHDLDLPTILLSISHCKQYATATAIWID